MSEDKSEDKSELPIEFDLFVELAIIAHERDITVNQLAEELITLEIEKHKQENKDG